MSARLAILASVVMPMMKVGVVRVLVAQGRVAMPVGMRLVGGLTRSVGMPMVHVVGVTVLMRQRLVSMLMLMPFGEVEIDADGHQDRRADQLRGDGLVEYQERQGRAQKRGR